MTTTIPPWLLSAQAQKAQEASMNIPSQQQASSSKSAPPAAKTNKYNAKKKGNVPPQFLKNQKKKSGPPVNSSGNSFKLPNGKLDWKAISGREKALEAQQQSEKDPAKKAQEHKEELRLEAIMKKATAARMAGKKNAVQSQGSTGPKPGN